MKIEYDVIRTLKKSEKAIVEFARRKDNAEFVVVKHLRGVNNELLLLISHLSSVYIPKIYDCVLEEEWLVVIEEFIEGDNLEDYLRNHRLNDKQKIDIAVQLCEAVKFLHSINPPIIHRDIKPHNIIINKHGALKLIDFDASRQYRADENRGDTVCLGTKGYAPPEQYGFKQTDVRSDIYPMGVVFDDLLPLEKKYLTNRWKKIVAKCTYKDPDQRYQTVDELEKEVKKVDFLRTVTGKTVLGWAVTILLAVIVLWQGCMLTRNHTTDNQNAGTGLPSPTETVRETLTPEPTATNIPVPETEPTTEPTPEPTATSTPSPMPTATGTPTETPVLEPTVIPEAGTGPIIPGVETVEALDAYFATTNLSVFIFYRNIAEQTRFSIGVDGLLDTKENAKLDKIVLTNYVTGAEIEIPASMVKVENEIVTIANEFLSGLENTYYQVMVRTTNDEYTGMGLSTVLKVSDAVDATKQTRALGRDWVTFYPQHPTDITVTVNCESVLKMEKLYVCRDGIYGEGIPELLAADDLTEVDLGDYKIIDDGKMLRLSKELLSKHADSNRVIFAALCNDGNYWRIVVEVDNGKPYWMHN